MNKLLIILAAACALGMFLIGAKWNDTRNDLEQARIEISRSEGEAEALRSAVEAVARSDARVADRLDQLNRDIQRSRNAPVTVGCGPVVHDAIERMRDRSK